MKGHVKQLVLSAAEQEAQLLSQGKQLLDTTSK
jgi:hypothetical protein